VELRFTTCTSIETGAEVKLSPMEEDELDRVETAAISRGRRGWGARLIVKAMWWGRCPRESQLLTEGGAHEIWATRFYRQK